MKIGITIDVPDLAAGIAFYQGVFGLHEVARPVPVYVVLECAGQSLCLMERSAGSVPTPAPGIRRDYTRHWTPVHLDFHVNDHAATLAALRDAGGTVEAEHPGTDGRPDVAFCADPFGHGLCILGPRGDSA